VNDTRRTDRPADARRLLEIVRALACELRPGAEGIERLGLEHALERDFGLDSLARVELLTRIEHELGVRLAETAFAEAETPRDLLRLMAGAAGSEPVVSVHSTEAETRGIETPPADIVTLTGLLDWHAAHHGERVHITLYGEDERGVDISYRDLQAEARTLAAGLLAQDLSAGQRVAIMLPTGREFFVAFYGALYAGCVPVPLYPPARPSQLEDHMGRIAGIVANAEAALFITDPRARLLGHLLRAQCASLRGVATVAERSRPVSASPPSLPTAAARDIAFLQYTSGSTGNPKGVVLTHANLIANLRAMEQASGVTSKDVFVSWLPLYHDMGLIGACMGSLAIGFHLVLMSPLAFLARPGRWLWAIHQHRASVSAAPNFAYELCVNKLDDRDLVGLDLSCWRLAYNGAEPVSPDTLERFATRFSAYGFHPAAMTPVYGLAESSVGLAFPAIGRGPLIDRVERAALVTCGIARVATAEDAHPLRIVCCGRALPGHAIRVIDANGREVPERVQGRVQFRGPSATGGYFRNPEATRRLIDGDWLNSGDLGYLAAGELYLSGREKDIIIRGGHNIYPQELEERVSQVPGIRRGGVVVFPASDARAGTERLVVLAETREKSLEARDRIIAEINRLAVDLLGLPADDIVLAPPRAVLKTSSGKVRRAACRERYERGEAANVPTRRAPWRQALRLAGSGIQASLRRLLGAAAGWVWSVWAWTMFAGAVVVFWPLIVAAPTLALRRRIARAGARLSLTLTGLWPRVEGLHQLQGRDALILVANHASYLDALILTAVLPPSFAYVAKQELLQRPFAGIPLDRLGAAFVARFDTARGTEDTRALEARARRGDGLILFAEGTFRVQPGLLPFRMGAFLAAARAGVAVVPVSLTGTRALLPGDTWRPRYSRIKVCLDAPIEAEGTDWSAALKLRDAVRDRVLAHLDETNAAL